MPLTRYRVRSEYGLADPELYRAADKDDPEALLEGVAMAGLVGVLRQLGDLAEFAAEIFHDLHEEVMATAARGHGLMVRVQQLEAEFPPIERAILSQTNHSSFFYNAGVDWHPNLRSEQNLIARGDLPRFVMDSYEECRGPPRLFLLDKFDVAGAGACLKRYTDPSFFKVEAAASGIATGEIQREKKIRKVKKKGMRWRNGETTPEVVPTSHTKLHQLFLEERIENGHSDPARLVKLKRRHLNGAAIDLKTGKSYMEKFLEIPPEDELACETSVTPAPLTSDYTSESGIRILEITTVSPTERSPKNESACLSRNVHEVVFKPSMNGFDDEVVDEKIVKVPDTTLDDEALKRSSPVHEVQVEKQLTVNGDGKTKAGVSGYESDDVTSEVDNYMDALASMESELETENEPQHNSHLCFLNAEIHGTDSDANEEHLESQAQRSDSQSVGNFSASDDGNNSFEKNRSSFLYSYTPSSLVDNTPPECDRAAKVFPSTETGGAENIDESSNELSVTAGSLEANPDEPVVSHDTCIKEESISDHGDARSGAVLIDLYPTPEHSDPGASQWTDSLRGPEIAGTSTEYITPESKVPDTVENGTNLVDSTSVDSEVPSQSNDFTKTSERYLVNKLEDGDPNVSNAVLHLSNISEQASEKESRGSSVDEAFQTQDEVEDSNKISCEIDSPSISMTEKQLCSSSLPDLETCSAGSLLLNNFVTSSDHSDVVEPDDLVSKVDNAVTATGVNLEVSPPIVDILEEVPSTVDSPQTSGLKEQQFPGFSENVPHLEPISTEASLPYSKENPNVEEIFGTVDFGERDLSTSYEESVGGAVVSAREPSSYLCDPGDDHANLDHVPPEIVEVEDVSIDSAVAANVVDNVSNDVWFPSDVVCSPSRNPTNLQESFLGFVVAHQKERELDDEEVSPECVKESETHKELDHLEVASTDASLNTSMVEKTLNSVSATDITAASKSLDLRDQESDFDNREDISSLPTSHLPEAETTSERSLSLQADQVGSENSLMEGAGPRTENLSEKSLKLQADQVGAECVVADEAGSHLEVPLEQPELQADQLDVHFLQVDQASINSSSFPSEQLEFLYHMGEERGEQIESPKCVNQEISIDGSLESCREDLPSQSPTSHAAVSSIAMLPEAAQLDLGEMPPLPPLPPMQWRMGKFSQGLFPTIQPSRADETAQADLPASQSGMQQPQNPFLPLTVVENEKSLHVAEPFVGKLAQTHTYSLQLPRLANDVNNQYNYLALGGTQSVNPFLTLPAISSDRDEHGYLNLEGEIVQAGSNSSQTPTTQSVTIHNHDASQKATQFPDQLAAEAGVDTMTPQRSLHSEVEQGNPPVTSMPPSTVADEQVWLGLLMPEAESAWSSNNSSFIPDSEVGKPNGNPVNKLPRPRNPLIDAVNAHGKSKLRKVTERVRPQIGPKADERDSLLEQIRTKSFNLKPATATRPSIPGPTPKTNLKVAAILEKANAIRQALAGSDDEDNDGDNWSDS